MKRIMSWIMVIIFLFTANGQNIVAAENNWYYTPGQIKTIKNQYKENENWLNKCLSVDNGLAYWKLTNNIKKDKILSWSLDYSSKLIGEYPDKKRYAEILANLMAMQTGQIAEQVSVQSQFDDLKEWDDLGLDMVKIANSIVGETKILDAMTKITDTVLSGTDIIIETKEEAKYYEATLKDYSQFYEFLDAITAYSENEELKEVANTLKEVNKSLLEARLEYLAETSANLGEYEFDFFYKELSFDLLKETELYKIDDTISYFVNAGEKFVDWGLSVIGGMQLGFDLTILIGNMTVGTNNTYNRYQEMKIIADISDALVIANKKINVSDSTDEKNLKAIQQKCCFYKALVVNHARGEYLIHSLLMEDAGGISDIRWIKEYFSKEGMKTDAWYNGQIKVLGNCSNYIEQIFVVDSNQGKINLTPYINSFEQMVQEIGGVYSEETGDHQNWIIKDNDLQYGNYFGSERVDELSFSTDAYSLFGISVGDNWDSIEEILKNDNWMITSINSSKISAQKDEKYVYIDFENNEIKCITFWRITIQESSPISENKNEQDDENTKGVENSADIGEEGAIQKAKEKLGDQFAYFCSATCEYERQKYYVVDVKTKVEDHYSKVTQILVKSDGTDAKEGLYSEGREPEFFE